MNDIKAIYLKDYKKPVFKIKDVDLLFELQEEYTTVTNVMSIIKLDDNSKDIELDSIDLELIELWINDLRLKDTRYVYENEKLKSEWSVKEGIEDGIFTNYFENGQLNDKNILLESNESN